MITRFRPWHHPQKSTLIAFRFHSRAVVRHLLPADGARLPVLCDARHEAVKLPIEVVDGSFDVRPIGGSGNLAGEPQLRASHCFQAGMDCNERGLKDMLE